MSLTYRSRAATGYDIRYVLARGNYVYGVDNALKRLRVFDVSDPDTPTVIANFDIGTQGNWIRATGNHLIIAGTLLNCIRSIDVSDPYSPFQADSLTVVTGSPFALDLSGNYAYVAIGGVPVVSKLLIVDVSDPTSLATISSIQTNLNNPRGVVVSGDYAFVSNLDGDTIEAFDVSNPLIPAWVGSVATDEEPRDMKVSGDYLYVVHESGATLRVYDISDPTNMLPVSSTYVGPLCRYISLSQDFAFVSRRGNAVGDWGELYMYDVSNPFSPTLEDTTTTSVLFAQGTDVVPLTGASMRVYLASATTVGSDGYLVVYDAETQSSSSSSTSISSSSSSTSLSSSSSANDTGHRLYAALDGSINVSNTRFASVTPCLKIDKSGLPHISWFEDKETELYVGYSFWDGSKWSWLGSSPLVSEVPSGFVPSSFALELLDDRTPIIGFATEDASGSSLVVATEADGAWAVNVLAISYSVDWVGLVKIGGSVKDNDSSSSSSSSSSADSLAGVVLVAHDDSGLFRFYQIEDAWTEVGSISDSGVNLSNLRLSGLALSVWLVSFDEDSIVYNRYDIDTATSLYTEFTALSAPDEYGLIWDVGCEADSQAGDKVLIVGWSSSTDTHSYVCSETVSSLGVESATSGGSYVAARSDVDVAASSGYIVNGYRRVKVYVESSVTYLLCVGQQSKLYHSFFAGWAQDLLDISGIGSGIDWHSLSTVSSNISFSNGGDVYYLKNTRDGGFEMSEPTVIVLNDKWVYIAEYTSDTLVGQDVSGTYNELVGGMARERIQPRLVSYSENSA